MISIIVSWRDRHELSQSIPLLIQAANVLNGDLTIVNFSGSSTLLLKQLDGAQNQIRIVNVDGQQYFNKAAAQNIGASHTLQPVLFFCDCDILVEPSLVSDLSMKLVKNEYLFATLAGVRESEINSREGKHIISFGYELRIRTASGRSLCIMDDEEDATNGTRNAPGLLFVRRSDFLAIDGYNSQLHGWGWEDQDIIARLTLGLGLTRLNEGHAIHISHNDHARIAHYPQVSSRWESRDRMFRTALNNYDNADFRGSYSKDILIHKYNIIT
jgi:predicted glycosyltransferase involved in capsule biosynthesis